MPGRKSDWDVFGESVRAVGAAIRPAGAPATAYHGGKTWDGYYWYTWRGSSDEFAAEIKRDHPQVYVPESAVELDCSGVAWTPGSEAPPPPPGRDAGVPDECPACGGRWGERYGLGVEEPSAIVCASCNRSGYERSLRVQRKLAGSPPPGIDECREQVEFPWVAAGATREHAEGVERLASLRREGVSFQKANLTRRQRRLIQFGDRSQPEPTTVAEPQSEPVGVP